MCWNSNGSKDKHEGNIFLLAGQAIGTKHNQGEHAPEIQPLYKKKHEKFPS